MESQGVGEWEESVGGGGRVGESKGRGSKAMGKVMVGLHGRSIGGWTSRWGGG